MHEPTRPHYADSTITLHHGDCLDVLRSLPDASVDSVVTDPPYGLANTDPAHVAETITRWVNGERDYLPGGSGFMGKAWDAFVPPVAVWDDCLRVLKPGGHVLAFAGSRTVDLMTLGLRLAGFDIRDSIAWLYGSGFPKSLDVSKAIDRSTGQNRARQLEFTAWMRSTGITAAQINDATGSFMGSHYLTDRAQAAIATAEMFELIRPWLPEVPEHIERLVAERTGIEWTDYVKRPQLRQVRRAATGRMLQGEGGYAFGENFAETSAASVVSVQWQGWGTALKPAFEPIVVARKPLAGTVAANVLAHGTGALNIDGCRTASSDADKAAINAKHAGMDLAAYDRKPGDSLNLSTNPILLTGAKAHDLGRWPANVILDQSQAEVLDAQSGEQRDGVAVNRNRSDERPTGTPRRVLHDDQGFGGVGGASRFFYVAKANASERPFIFRPTCDCEDSWPTHTPSPARATGATTEPGSSSTSKSGSGTTGDPSLTGTTSTTSTGTSSTTTQPTSSPSPRPITSASTPAANSETASGGSPADSAVSSSRSASLTGISVAKGGRSMDDAAPATLRAWSAKSVCGSCGAPTRREAHATVKPLALMRWLVRLVTPPGGTVLEPFAGSGATVEACLLEGFQCIAIEREADYLPLIVQRVNRRRDPVAAVKGSGGDGGLFDLLGEGA